MTTHQPRGPALAPALAALVLGPLIITLAVLGLVAERGGRRATHDLAYGLQREIAESVRTGLTRDLDAPHLLAALDADALARGALVNADDALLLRHFRAAIHAVPTVSYVQFGRADGSFVGVERADDGLRAELAPAGNVAKTAYRLDEQASPAGAPLAVSPGYNATTRPWYRAAIQADGPAWSEVYQFTTRDAARLGITAVRPVRDASGALLGVAGADLVLSHLAARLASPRLGPEGRIVLFEPNGLLVAATGVDHPYLVNADRETTRLQLQAAPDEVVAAFGAYFSEHAELGVAANDAFTGRAALATGPAFVYVAPFRDDYGLDWRIAVVLPAARVDAALDRELGSLMLLATTILLIAALGAAFAARRITAPLHQLAHAADALRRGQWSAPVPQHGARELRALADSFSAMRDDLRAARDELERALADQIHQGAQLERAHADAERARAEADVANRAKSSFLASMSHELRTPLNAILGYADLLHECADEDDVIARRADLDHVRNAGKHLLDLVNLVLDLSKVEAGRLTVTLVELDLRALAEELAAAVRPLVERNHNQIVLNLPNAPLVVRSDAGRLRQVVLNLLGNAAKFTRDGTVTLTLTKVGSGARLDVADTGPGIAADDLEYVFEPFARVGDNHDGSVEGTGLGLSLVRRLARRLGCEVTVASTLGVGTTFTVTLPPEAPAETPAPAPSRR